MQHVGLGLPIFNIIFWTWDTFWIFMLFQAVNTVKLNFKAGLFSSTFQFEHSFLAKSQC